MEKKDVVRNIIISANDFKFKEINGVEFETAVKYYIDQLESNQPEPAMPKIAEIIRAEINAKDFSYFVNTCVKINEKVPQDEIWVYMPDGKIQKFINVG